MRLVALFASIVLTATGLVAVYLFGAGALSGLTLSSEAVHAVADRALRPFVEADPVAIILLAAGAATLVVGLLLAPRADLWVALTPGQEPPEPTRAEARRVAWDTVVEFGVLWNAVIIAGLIGLITLGASRAAMAGFVGALTVATGLALIVGAGLITMLVVWRRRKGASPRRRPVLALAAGLHVVELVLAAGFVVFGLVS